MRASSRSSCSFNPILLLPLLILSPTYAQISERNCTLNETINGLNRVRYSVMNATGSHDFEGFGGRDPTNTTPVGNWTWTIGLQALPNNTLEGDNWFDKAIWIDTHGTNLADEELDYEMCYMTMSLWEKGAQEEGQDDTGDCQKFLGNDCVEDWKKALINQATSRRGISRDQTPCYGLRNSTPDSCKKKAAGRIYGPIPPENRTCAFGQGTPEYDTAISLPARNDTDAESFYDKVATETTPVFVVAWQKGGGWADARVMCLRTTEFADGSRVPKESSSRRLGISSLLAVAALVMAVLI